MPFRTSKQGNPTVVEMFDNLSMDPKSNSYFLRRMKDRSCLVTVERMSADDDITAPAASADLQFLADGEDGSPVSHANLKGDPNAEPGEKKGLAALEEVDEIAILCCPEEVRDELRPISEDIVLQCEKLKDRFAVIQASYTPPVIAQHRPLPRESKYSAYYYPWLVVRDR